MNAADNKDNPRLLLIHDTDLERTLRFMEVLEEEDDLDEEVRQVLLMLSDCFPAGTKRDLRGASLKQLKYICILAGFEEDQVHEFCRIINLAEGMDSLQAHHLITKLEATRNRSGRG